MSNNCLDSILLVIGRGDKKENGNKAQQTQSPTLLGLTRCRYIWFTPIWAPQGPENDPQESPKGQFGTKNVPKMDLKTARDPQKAP